MANWITGFASGVKDFVVEKTFGTADELSLYKKGKKIGSGAFGQVYICEKDGKQFAYKEMDASNKDKLNDLKREYLLVQKLKGQPNVLHFEFGSHDKINQTVVLISELINGIDLERLIYSDVPITIPQIKWIIAQLLTGLLSMSVTDIVHFDVKPSNIMITYDYKVKYIDFGTSLEVGTKIPTLTITANYANRNIREIVNKGKPVTITENMKKYDLWCVGCTLYELYNRNFLFKSVNDKDHPKQLKNYETNFSSQGSNFFNINDTEEEVKMNEFFKFFMKTKFDQMPELQEVLEHEWIKDFVNLNLELHKKDIIPDDN